MINKLNIRKKKEELFNSLKSNMEDGKKKREEILDLIKGIESSKEEIRKRICKNSKYL